MTVREEASLKNVFVIYILFASTFVSFFWGGYHVLNPTLFLVGLFVSSVVCVWASMQMRFASLLVMMLVTLATAAVDEYAHTSAGIFAYFDGGLPSPLTVFGWSLFVLGMLTFAKYLHKLVLHKVPDGLAERIAPAMASICFVLVAMAAQNYLPHVSWLLGAVYGAMFLASLRYSRGQTPGWNLSVMISSVLVGATMEALGAMERLWSFRGSEPLLPFMAFTWSLRIWTVLYISRLLDAEYEI